MHGVSALPLNWRTTPFGWFCASTSRILENQSQMAVPPNESWISAVSPVASTSEVKYGSASHDKESPKSATRGGYCVTAGVVPVAAFDALEQEASATATTTSVTRITARPTERLNISAQSGTHPAS